MGQYQFGPFYFDSSRGVLTEVIGGRETGEGKTLRQKVSLLLAYLIEHRARVVSKDELLDALWQHGDYRENSLTQSIRELRKLLGDNAQEPSYIKTFQQRGYQWIHPVSLCEAPGALGGESESAGPGTSSLDPAIAGEKPARTYSSFFMIGLGLLLMLLIGYGWQAYKNSAPVAAASIPSLVILPFLNETQDPSLDWVRLGLADMISTDVQRTGLASLTPPSIANSLILGADIPWPATPDTIRALLKAQHIEYGLLASVRLHNKQQVLDFQLLCADGRIQQGAVTYPSLPNASRAIAQQLLHLLRPTYSLPAADNGQGNQLTGLVLAQGMSALQTQGPEAARHFFAAAQLLDAQDGEALLRLAQVNLLTGRWRDAEAELQAVDKLAGQDVSLAAQSAYWQAELAYRRGNSEALTRQLDSAIDLAERINNVQVRAQGYRLKARLAWGDMQWQAHHQWLEKADELFPRADDLSIEAEKLFYLGDPVSSGLEKDPQADLSLNKTRLLQALNFYTQLGSRPMMAASQFGLAQNYYLDIQTRQQALAESIQLYRDLNQPYELAETLVYAAFVQLQLHQGAAAMPYLVEAKRIVDDLGAGSLRELLGFYTAFAALDQGLDQRARGQHGVSPAQLNLAIEQFKRLIEQAQSPITTANAQVLLAWAYSDLQQFDLALAQLKLAKQFNQTAGLDIAYGYSSYSMMRIYLAQKNYDKVIALAQDKFTTRLQFQYLARAYYEQGDSHQAAATLLKMKQAFPGSWRTDDELRLEIYQQANPGRAIDLPPEPLAHSIYCESDWQLPGA